MNHYDVIIIGGGPAGSTCGYLLNKNNINNIIIDKKAFPRDKLCAGVLTKKTYKLIDKIYNSLSYDYRYVEDVSLYYNEVKKGTIKLNKGIRTIERSKFDDALINEYLKSGGTLLKDELLSVSEKDNKVFITLISGLILSCNYLIGADGALSKVRGYLEPNFSKGMLCLEQHNNETYLNEAVIAFGDKFNYGYFFAFPNNNYIAIGYGDKDTNLESFEDNLLKYNFKTDSNSKGAYIPMMTKQKYAFKKNIILIGDAGGYVNSISGEGIYYAIKTGQNAAFSTIKQKTFKGINRGTYLKIRFMYLSSLFFHSKLGKFLTKLFLNSKILSASLIDFFLLL